MGDTIKGSSSPTATTLKRHLNHGTEQGTNGDGATDSSPKRPRLSDNSQVTNHKTFPEPAAGTAGINGAITRLSPDDSNRSSNLDRHSHTQEPPLHRTSPTNGEGATDSGDMQADQLAADGKETANNVVNNISSRTPSSVEGELSVGGRDETKREEERDSEVPMEIAKSGVTTETSNGQSIGHSNSVDDTVKVLQSAKLGGEDSSAKLGQTGDLPSNKTQLKDDATGAAEPKSVAVPTVSRRKDNRPLSIREWSDKCLSKEEEEDEGDEEGDGSMGEEETTGEQGSKRKPGLRVTRSRTRKAKGIEDPPPKSIYAELSEDSDDIDDTPPLSPWIDPLSKLTPELLECRTESAKVLREALRIEESKLLFLKKVKQNQQQPTLQQPSTNHPPANLSQNRLGPEMHKSAGPQGAHMQQVNRARISLSKPGFPGGHPPGQQQQQRQAMPLLIRGSAQQGGRNVQSGQGGPPPLMLVQNKQNLHNQQGGQNRVPGHQVPRQQQQQGSKPGAHHVLQQRQGIHVTNQQIAHQRSSSAPEPQSAASRQAAAKLALRKQLEKTLLQIPPPKPPPPELHFLPSAANSEFIILVGLEEVVNTILKIDQSKKDRDKENPKFLNPYKCSQCRTDFTTIWKQDPKHGIMCEACIVSNQKRALKAEHTNRLKTAFVKALQQEQEIEQRMQQSQQQTKPAQAHVTHQPTRSMYNMSSQQQQQQNIPSVRRVLNPPVAAAQQQRVPTSFQYIQHLHQGGAASGQIPMLTKQQMNSVYRMPTTDRQREYLLDMIPSKGLGQQAIVWKR